MSRGVHREVAFLHLFLSIFFLVEHLCHSEAICAGLWDLYEFVTGLANANDAAGSTVDAYVHLFFLSPHVHTPQPFVRSSS